MSDASFGRAASGVLGICLAISWAGAGCQRQQDFQGQIGDGCETGRECMFGLSCQEKTQTCQMTLDEEPEGTAATCVTNNDCGDGLLCQPETTTCQVIEDGDGIPGPTLLGGSCAEDAECDEGLVCQFASETCQPPSDDTVEGLGATCITNGDCAGDLICQDATASCQPQPIE